MLLPRNVNIDAMALNAPPNSSGTLQVPIALQVERSRQNLRAQEVPGQRHSGMLDEARNAQMGDDTAANYANALVGYTAAETKKMAGVGGAGFELAQVMQQSGLSPADLMNIIYR